MYRYVMQLSESVSDSDTFNEIITWYTVGVNSNCLTSYLSSYLEGWFLTGIISEKGQHRYYED